MKELLDQWEKEAEENIEKWVSGLDGIARQRRLCRKVLKLISAYRIMEEALKLYSHGLHNVHPQLDIKGPAKVALSEAAKVLGDKV